MRWGVLVVALGACNQVYGLDQTRLPPPDAPFACPPIGGAAPEFSRDIFQATTQQLQSYHFNPTGTLAVGVGYPDVLVGSVGTQLVVEPSIVPEPLVMFLDPHPSPDGERIYLQRMYEPLVTVRSETSIVVYARAGTGWKLLEELPDTMSGTPSTIFRGDAGDRMILNTGSELVEYEREPTGWVVRGTHAATDLRIDPGATLAVTSDGLRAVFLGESRMQMLYTDREKLDGWFRAPQRLVGIPRVADLQLTDDCARIYYADIGTAFYSQQR